MRNAGIFALGAVLGSLVTFIVAGVGVVESRRRGLL